MTRSWIGRLKAIRRDLYAVYLACRDPRTPWYARWLAAMVVGYALSPIDLIPDFVPVLGYLDDVIVVSAGLMLVIRLLPPEVLADARRRAEQSPWTRPRNWTAALVIILLWLIGMALLGAWLWSLLRHR